MSIHAGQDKKKLVWVMIKYNIITSWKKQIIFQKKS